MNKHKLLLELNNLEHWLADGSDEARLGLEEGIAALKEKIKAEAEPLVVDDRATLERGSDGFYRLRPGTVFTGLQDWPASFLVTVTVTERKPQEEHER
jgi:hypothetical protein